MRIRAVLTALSILVVTACSQEAGPTPQQQPEDPGPEALYVKLDALTADECFRFPDEMAPSDCQKYVTQMANIPERAQNYAGTEHPDLAEAAKNLDAGIKEYRQQACEKDQNREACVETVTDIASLLEEVRTEVAALPDVGKQPN